MLQPPHQAASYTASSRETGASPSPRSMAILCQSVAVPPHCPRAHGRYTTLLHVISTPLTPPCMLLSSISGLFAVLPTLSPGYPVSAPAVPSARKALALVSLCWCSLLPQRFSQILSLGLWGPSWDRPLPYSLCFSSSLKDLDNSIWCMFPELLYRFENFHHMEDVNHLMTKST